MQTPPSQSRQIRQFLAAFPPTAWHIVLGFILLCFVSGWIFVVLALFDPPLRTALKDVTEIIRNVLIGLLGILAGGIGLYLAFIRSIAMRQSAEAASHASAIADRKETREKASTAKALAIDSLTRAIEQLGHGDISVRLGGIHALDRLARNDPSETQAVAEILAAHVRQSSDKSFPNDRSEWHLEIQLCILKLGAYRRLLPVLQFDLRESDLRGLDFSGLDFSDSRFDGTNFSNSKIFGSKFSACSINNVTFNKVNLYNVDFANANFNQANFMGCHAKG